MARLRRHTEAAGSRPVIMRAMQSPRTTFCKLRSRPACASIHGGISTPRDTPTSRCSPSRPDHPDALNLLGTALLQLGQPEAAVDHLERAARARRNHPGVLGNLAQAYFALARYADARETFRKASRLDPGAAQFQLGIANSLAMEGRLGRGRDAAAAAHEPVSRATRSSGSISATCCATSRRPADALPCFLEALAIDPRAPRRAQQSGRRAAETLPVR